MKQERKMREAQAKRLKELPQIRRRAGMLRSDMERLRETRLKMTQENEIRLKETQETIEASERMLKDAQERRLKEEMDEIKKKNKDMRRQNRSNLQTIREKKLAVNTLLARELT